VEGKGQDVSIECDPAVVHRVLLRGLRDGITPMRCETTRASSGSTGWDLILHDLEPDRDGRDILDCLQSDPGHARVTEPDSETED